MTDIITRVMDKKFWDDLCKDTEFTPELVIDLYEDEVFLRDCSKEFKSLTENHRDYYLRNDLITPRLDDVDKYQLVEDIISCATPKSEDKYTPGYLNSHVVETTIKGVPYFVELPEVRVQQDATPYVTHLDAVARIKRATKVDPGYRKSLMRSFAYCHRLNINVAPLYAHAYAQGYKTNELDRMNRSVARIADRLKTQDYYLADWAQRALEHCNTVVQCNIIRWVYIRAAMFNTKQPRICKKTIALELGCNRNIIIRLFKRLESAGLMVQREETYSYDYVRMAPKSNARIVNLDPSESNRWEDYKEELTLKRTSSEDETVYIEDIISCATPEIIIDEVERRKYASEWRKSGSEKTLDEYILRQNELKELLTW